MMTFGEMERSLRQRQKEDLDDLELETDRQNKKSQELDEMWARFIFSGRTGLWATQYRLGFVAADIGRRVEKYDERYVHILNLYI